LQVVEDSCPEAHILSQSALISSEILGSDGSTSGQPRGGFDFCIPFESIKLIENGETEVAFYDLVDGKQRLTTILEFIRGEFTDKNGNSFGDFSEFAKRTFFAFDRLSFGMIDEGTSDESVIFAFFNINSTGTPVNPNHLAKIKQIEF
jgi:hypothetical protein